MARKQKSIEEKVMKVLKANPHFSYQEACRFVLIERENNIKKLKKQNTKNLLTNKVSNTKKKKKPQKRKASIWAVSGGAVSPK